MWWKYLAGLLMSAVTITVFLLPPPQKMIGDASRIFFFHVPAALMAFICFVVAAVYAAIYLKNRLPDHDRRAVVAAEIGMIFTVIATISGAIFSQVTWGVFWNWDPRQTSIFVVLLIYAAYFALRQAVQARETRARLSAVYLLIAGVLTPLLFFVLPRLYPSLHPNDSLVSSGGGFAMTLPVGLAFGGSLISFFLLYLWISQLATGTSRIRDEEEEQL